MKEVAVYLPVSVLQGWHIDSQEPTLGEPALVIAGEITGPPLEGPVSIRSQEPCVRALDWSSCPIYLQSVILLI